MFINLQKLISKLSLMEGVEKSLSGEIQLDTLRSAQSSLLFSLGAQNPELMAQGIARAKTLVTKFRGEVTNLIRDFSSKQISQAEALVRWKELSGKTYKDLFTAGTQAAGNPYYQKLGLTRKDVAFISSARRDETKHFKNFLEDIEAGRGQIDYEERAGFYADSGMGQFWNGQVAGHGDDVLIRWILGVVMTDHCQDCITLSSKTYTWKTLPFVPRSCNTECLMNCHCFTDGRQGIMTDRGVKRISKIREGDRVLTHAGKFEKVSKVWKEVYEEEVIEVEVEVLGRRRKYKTTKDHKFMKPDGDWIMAVDLKVGDNLFAVVQKCPQCATCFISHSHTPSECCSRKCSSKYFKNTKNANIKVRELIKEGKFSLLLQNKWRKGKTYEEIYGSRATAQRLVRSNSMKETMSIWRGRPAVERVGVEAMIRHHTSLIIAGAKRKGKTYEEIAVNVDPNEWRRHVILPPYKRSSLELKTETELLKLGVKVNPQEWIGRYRVDFLLPKQKIVVECDGEHWHSTPSQKASDLRKDKFLEEQGFTVLRFTEKEILASPQLIAKRLGFTLLNHNGRFVDGIGTVTKVTVLKPVEGRLSYQLTVENAHSYVAWEGVISKNCDLEFDSLRPERPPGLPGVPGRGSAAAITAPGRNVMVFDDKGNIMLGGLQKTLDDLYSQLYKARQMITASETAAERTDWIRIRREINEAIVKARGNYKAMPTISVSTLTDVVKSAMRSGGVVTSLTELKVGAEVVFIRGDYSAFGVVKMLRNQLCFSSSTGVTLPVNDETDVVFVLGKRPAVFPAEQLEEGGAGSGFHGHAGRPGEVGGSSGEGAQEFVDVHGKSGEGIEKAGQSLNQTSFDALPEAHRSILREYTVGADETINSVLRGRLSLKNMNDEDAEQTKTFIKDLDAATATAIQKSVVTYRGVSAGFFRHLLVGQEFVDKGFTSVSLDKAAALDSSHRVNSEYFNTEGEPGKSFLLTVRVPKGTKGYYIGGNTDRDILITVGNENELLLAKNTRFRCVRKTKNSAELEVI